MDGSVYAEPNITAILPGAGPSGEDIVTTESREEFVPRTPEPFTYDADGNLTSDGRWLYTWNGENRLIAMETKSGLATNLPRHRLTFLYDYMGRRVRKIVADWTGAAYIPVSTNYYLYHGWNLLIERDANSPIRQYTWGLDLSGTLEGAGGVGGLLAVTDHSQGGNPSESYAAYDGNGNVTALVDSPDGSLAAVYEYDPFGNLLRATGPMAGANPFRFSTKYQDDETRLVHYGFRYLSPELGRWLSRDPIEEDGGRNLYAFVVNAPIRLVDYDGLRYGNPVPPSVPLPLDLDSSRVLLVWPGRFSS
jgi:RHS repeat-associated protein